MDSYTSTLTRYLYFQPLHLSILIYELNDYVKVWPTKGKLFVFHKNDFALYLCISFSLQYIIYILA